MLRSVLTDFSNFQNATDRSTETSVTNCQSTLCNVPEERRILYLNMMIIIIIIIMIMTRIRLVSDNVYSDAFRIGIAVMFEY